MKILLAFDSFKESMTSREAADNFRKGFLKSVPSAVFTILPMSDGGEGFVHAMAEAGGKIKRKKVTGPLGTQVNSYYAVMNDGKSAVVEMATASGLALVPLKKRNPLKTTTYGTGELIAEAVKKGYKNICVGIGGSATTDGGAGMAQAMGVKFFDGNGKLIKKGAAGRDLDKIESIDLSGCEKFIKGVTFQVASDVTNPLCGKRGAAQVYGPQKGADADGVKKLDENLRRFARIIKKETGISVLNLPGAGAAGGLGAGLIAFLGADLRSGIDIALDTLKFTKLASVVDIVVTGEGRVDKQTISGKVIHGITVRTKKAKKPLIAIGGSLSDDSDEIYKHGVNALFSLGSGPCDLAYAIKNGKKEMLKAGERIGRLASVFIKASKKK
ncbi:MAG: glycerate kinase [Fibrobacterota bacterium]